ncbi:MAG TPA: SLATT domain-containing protein [Blastocatellia bacterium]|nr:SLATT domain-containing protein [Blastocatellia bacterium]
MTERDKQFLTLYQTHRYEDQKRWYDQREQEFESAHRQGVILTVSLLALTAIVSVMPDGWLWSKQVWTVLGVVLPALSTALSAYTALYAFKQQARLYQDASRALHRTEAADPNLSPASGDAAYHRQLVTYVAQVEDIFRKEQGQWGQLINEIKRLEPPAEKKPEENE